MFLFDELTWQKATAQGAVIQLLWWVLEVRY